MNILLLNTPFLPMYSRASRSPAVTKSSTLYFPMWLAYATGVLQKAGHKARLVDAPAFEYSKDDVVEIAKEFEAEMVVVDTTTGSIDSDLKVAADIKKQTKAFVVLVGTHASALPEHVLEQCVGADAVARGEYEHILRDLADCLAKRGPLGTVRGLTYRENGSLHSNPDMPKIENLDDFPFVSKVYKEHLSPVLGKYYYGNTRHPLLTILSGRGCPHQCCYCVYPQVMLGHKYRYRSAKNVVDELEYIRLEFPQVKEIFMEDDTLTVNKKRVFELCEEILRRKLKTVWSTNSRAQVDLETLRIMKRAGCRLLCVGYESGDQGVLDALGKNLKLEEVYEFTKNARRAGILIHGCFLVGNPGETKESLAKTLEMAKELNPDTAQFYPIMVYPGTRAYQWARDSGFLTTEDFSKWLTPEGLHSSVVSRPDLTHEELVRWADNARREFYLRPSYLVMKTLQAFRHPSEISRLLRGARSLFRFVLPNKDADDCRTCS